MEAKDGSFGFDFKGEYDRVLTNKLIYYTIGGWKKVKIDFTNNGNETKIIQTFETESENSVEQQQEGWQSILNNFTKYVESVYVKSTLS